MYESSTKETKWVCIQLAHEDLGQFEEAHHRNIQDKFYNEKLPLVYESDIIGDYLYEEHGATLKHKCGKRIVALSLLSFSLSFFWAFYLFYGLSLFFLFLTWDNALENDDHHTSIYLQLKNYNSRLRTKYDSM